MVMTPAVAAARKRRKRLNAIGTAVFVVGMVAFGTLVSWSAYQQWLDFAEPWVRIVVIIGSWCFCFGIASRVINRFLDEAHEAAQRDLHKETSAKNETHSG